MAGNTINVGGKYSRNDLWELFRPGQGKRPRRGVWDSSYVREGSILVVFLNIGTQTNEGTFVENDYDEETEMVTWFGKAKSHSDQPIIKCLIDGELTPYLFARWDNKDPFTFLGVGKLEEYEDGYKLSNGVTAIRLIHSVKNSPQSVCPNVQS